MKKINSILLLLLVIFSTVGCSKNYDEHYKEMDSTIVSEIVSINEIFYNNIDDVVAYTKTSEYKADLLNKVKNQQFIKEYDSEKYNIISLANDIESLENTLIDDFNKEYSQEYINYINATKDLLNAYRETNDYLTDYILTLETDSIKNASEAIDNLDNAMAIFCDARLNFLYTVGYSAEDAKQLNKDFLTALSKTL